MNTLSWLIVIAPMAAILWVALYSRRYVRDVADYLAAGRVAGRYVMSVGDLAASLSVITLVAMVEQNYQTGLGIGFWGAITSPIWLWVALTGYCVYRFRETRCLSIGQFLEVRYSRRFRITAASVRTIAELMANAIGPAIAVRFFIYFLGIPHEFTVLGLTVPTYVVLVAFSLFLAILFIWPAGRISLLITDSIQGILCYPIFIIFTIFVLASVSWFGDVAPVMLDRPPGESFLNPMDVSNLRDFNLFALFVTVFGGVLNRAAWIGNDITTSGRTPHEQKMAGILGTWRNGFAHTMMALLGIFVITFMLAPRFAEQAHDVRIKLTDKVAGEVVDDPITRQAIDEAVSALAVPQHRIGIDPPYSRTDSPDTDFLKTVHASLLAHAPDSGTGNRLFQEFRSLYNQMMLPSLLGSLFNPVLMGLFTLLMIMLLLSTDASRIFNSSSTIVQDLVVPLKKEPMGVDEHLSAIKRCSLLITLLFFVISLFLTQLDYIVMFTTIVTAVWLGAAGPIMVGGLYTRFGTTAGAWASLFVGSGIPILGLVCQRTWANRLYPFLEWAGLAEPLGRFLEAVSYPFHPWIVWTMDPVKFPINSIEIYFIAMLCSIASYVLVSRLTMKEPYNLERMLHRGIYSDGETAPPRKEKLSWSLIVQKVVGIDREYTRGDKVIAWSVVLYSLFWGVGVMFAGVLIWNMVAPWTPDHWAYYFFVSIIVTGLTVGTISTIWFLVGGTIDTWRLFRDLQRRVANPLDDGRVEGHVSAVDLAHVREVERRQRDDN